MEEPPALPYFAPADELPEPLPSRDAIAAANVCYANTECGRVVRVGKHCVVKHGPEVSLIEGQSTLCVVVVVLSVILILKGLCLVPFGRSFYYRVI